MRASSRSRGGGWVAKGTGAESPDAHRSYREINAAVVSAPELVNEDPYDKGWLLKVKPADQAELGNLLDAAQYDSLTA